MNLGSYVLAVLVGEHHQQTAATLECLTRWRVEKYIEVDVVINHQSRLDYFSFLEGVRERHPGKHLIAMHADIFFAEDFLFRLIAQIELIEDAGATWGVLGPAGVNYPYFKIMRNMVDHHGILYPFPRPLPAIHLDGHLLVINKDLVLDFEPDYRGFHHYDTLICMRSWEQGRAVFVINLPLRHLGQGNVAEWKQRSEVLGRVLGKTYGNKSLMTSMGPVSLTGVSGVARDFYRHEVDVALAHWVAKRSAPDVVLVVRVDADDVDGASDTLLSVCSQFEKPERVILLHPPELGERLAPLIQYFGTLVDLLPLSGAGAAMACHGDVLLGSAEELRAALLDDAVVSFLDTRTVLFPNFVRDMRRFHLYGIDVGDVVAALDVNYAVHDAVPAPMGEGERLVSSWKTENIDDLVTGGEIPLASFAIPVDLLREVLDDHLYGALSERVLVFKIAARAPVYFLRRLGGLLRLPKAALEPRMDPLADVSEQSEFLRAHYPFGYIWMKHREKAPVQAPTRVSREQVLAMKLSQYPRVIDAIYKVYQVARRLRTCFT